MIQRHPFGIRERSVGVSGFCLGHCGIIDVSMPKAGPCQPVLRLGRPLARFGLEDLPRGAAAASYAWAAPTGRPARPMLTLIVNLRIPRRCRSRGALIRSADVAMVVPLRRGWCTQKRSQGVTDPRGAGRWAAIGGGVAKRAMQAAATFGQICI
jgi:hypothetical protein